MRLLFLILGYHPWTIGGACRYVAELAPRLVARGHRVSVLFPDGSARRFEESGVELIAIQNERRGHFLLNWRAENAAAAENAARFCQGGSEGVIVLCHAFFGPAAETGKCARYFLFTGPWADEFWLARGHGLRGGRRLAARVISGVLRRTERRALRKSEAILTISRYYEESLPVWHGTGLPPIARIGGGVDLDRFHPPPDRDAARRRIGVADGELLLVAARRLDGRMGLDLLIEAMSGARESLRRVVLRIAGDGPEREKLVRRVNELGLGDRVRFCGRVTDDELVELLGAADCTVLPSIGLEGFGLATVESLACGTPVLGSASGATPEILSGLEPALLFVPGSVEAIATKLRSLADGELRLPSRQACRAFAETHYSWDATVSAFEQAIEGARASGVVNPV